MTLLSVIVPVYRVERYLTDCLDSMLGQSCVDIEVIAVDDASDDHSGEILARYAAVDPRLTVVAHERNQGLGAARNTGLAQARGDYVWFVDSDDWLPAGTLAAIADRLVETRPDLLVTAYTRFHPDGRVRHHSLARVGRGRPAPDTFRLCEQPGLLSILHIACNKVVRRRFLNEIGLTFGPGWYEDVSFSFPLMLAAERISLLDRSCYAYRQRPEGAITHTVSRRHFEVFTHWDRVFTFINSRPDVSAEMRGLIFERMIWHLLEVLGHPSRIPSSRRRDFFAEVTARYHAHLPIGGHRPPPGVAGLKHRLVARDAYRLFESLRTVHRIRLGVLQRIRRPPRAPAAPAPAPAAPPEPAATPDSAPV